MFTVPQLMAARQFPIAPTSAHLYSKVTPAP